MGNWKTSVQVRDLAEDQKLEMICKACGRLTYIDKAIICEKIDRSQLYLDEIEAKARCKARGCKGKMRMAMVRMKELSGFVGGLA